MAVVSVPVQDVEAEVIEGVAAALYSEWAIERLSMCDEQIDANFRLLGAAASIREDRVESGIVAELEALADIVERLVPEGVTIGELPDGFVSGPTDLRAIAIGYRNKFQSESDAALVGWAEACRREERLYQD